LDPDRIRRAQHGDVAAFTELIEARIPAMVRTATAILGQEADARDAVQDALVAAWRSLPRLRDVAAFDVWLMRILVHRCRRGLRQSGAARVREIPGEALEALAAPDAHAAAERRDALERAFDRLSVEHRAVLVLHHLDGRPVAEIASILELPVGTVKSRLFHARAALDRALRREAGG
jgi:RNA polymerase sigma-70 factor (ECF subfamily)